VGLRFRRRVTIAPGIALNVSKSGLGISAGPRGAKIGIGKRGVHRSIGIPGTGLHYREQTAWGSGKNKVGSSRATGTNEAVLELHEDGSVVLVDSDGSPVPARRAKLFRDQNADQIQAFLERACERWNAGIDEILGVHIGTPDPTQPLKYEARPFPNPKPDPFVPRKVGFLGLLWRPRRERIEQENEARRNVWDAAVAEWHDVKRRHDEREEARRQDYELNRLSNVAAMERVLEDRLSALDWPRTTAVSYQVRDEGQRLWLDVDLPEIEDMPTERASPAARGLKLNIRSKSDTQVRREYMQHIHGVLFRIVGEVFRALPTLVEVVASGYSQRQDPTTGHTRDDYLVSARITRRDWSELNFQHLDAVDVVASFERFELRRKMTKTGIFTPIEPHVEGEA
jgi:hypothetical protein